MSRSELGHKCNVSAGFIAHIETGRSLPGVQVTRLLAQALGVPEIDVFRLAGHAIPEVVDDNHLLEHDWRLFFAEDWPRMNKDERQLMRDMMGMMKGRVKRRID